MQATHETHIAIKKNKLCPFKLLSAKKTGVGICNWHSNLEIIHVTEGNGSVQYGGKTLKIETGDTVVINSGALHCFFSDGLMGFIGIIIDDDFCKESGIVPERFDFDRLVKDPAVDELIRACADTIETYHDSKNPIYAAKARSQVLSLLVFLAEGYSRESTGESETKNPSEEYVKKVIGHLIDHYTDDVTLDSLAALCGITKFHLARVFKQYTGDTVFTYLNALKCKNAQKFLASGLGVTETATRCGFESVSYFSRTYKRVMGFSPRAEIKNRSKKGESTHV